jgi:hypothetical protein
MMMMIMHRAWSWRRGVVATIITVMMMMIIWGRQNGVLAP